MSRTQTTLALLATLAVVALGADALARVGGGESYGGGGGGGGGDGEGIGILIELVFRLLFWLCLEHPVIGIPLTLAVVIGIIVVKARPTPVDTGQDLAHDVAPAPRRRGSLVAEIEALRQHDPAFSRHLFLDFAALLYSRVQEARGDGPIEPVLPWLAPEALAALDRSPDRVDRVIAGGITLVGIHVGKQVRLTVTFEANVREHSGGTRELYLRERWTFERALHVLSRSPEEITRLGCPSCGAAGELDVHGRCTFCHTAVNQGEVAWVVRRMEILERRDKRRLEVALSPGGVEPGTNDLTVMQPAFAAGQRAFFARNPAFTWAAFEERARGIFLALQDAWSTLDWERARPHETDHLFQTHRYWIERYRSDGLRNVLADVRIDRVVPCRIEQDAWFEAVTVRIFASMRDWVEDAQGRVVGGNRSVERSFSEYWTFIRRIGVAERQDRSLANCPSCGAQLQVNAAAICAFCESKIAGGDFDWVASLIEQDEAYRG